MTDKFTIADTVHTDRKDIFVLEGDEPRHVGTITSGSRKHIKQFEDDMCLLRQAGPMRSLLDGLVSGRDRAELERRAGEILSEIEAPYREG